MKTLLFDSSDLACFSVGSGPSCVVTFGPWQKQTHGNAAYGGISGFGQDAIEKLGYEGIHVIPRRNHWFQTDDIEPLLEAVRRRADGRGIFTYGSSMGGYAAINFSKKLDARFLALSPQFTLAPSKMPNDRRWQRDTAGLAWNHDYAGDCPDTSGYAFYDPKTADIDHAHMIATHTSGTIIPCAFGSHHLAHHINKTYGLPRLLDEFVRGTFSTQIFQRERRRNRAQHGTYLANLYVANLDAGNSTCRIEKARALFGSNTEISVADKHKVVAALVRAGLTKRARQITDGISIDDVDEKLDRVIVSKMLIATGRYWKARGILRELAAADPEDGSLRVLLRQVKGLIRDRSTGPTP